MISRRWFPIVLTAVLTTACFTAEVSTAPSSSPLNGRWRGTFTEGLCDIYLNIIERDRVVTAEGYMGSLACGGNFAVTGHGVFIAPQLELTVEFGWIFTPMGYTAKFAGDSLVGGLNGYGRVNEPVTLRRVR